MWSYVYLIVLFTLKDVIASKNEGLLINLVNTNVGPIQGFRATDGNYTAYTGIPFAEVDKDNPFGISKRYPKFEEPFEAFYESAICPQIEEFNNTLTGTLDCLQLNVYVPDTASQSNPVPVIVWIHGGAYQIGYANRYLYGPWYLVRHDVILVTINYRVGPYGFMCLDTPQVPGNQGLKDQLLGLRWVNENIEYFGGDPKQITAFGQSVGSMSVHLHLLSLQEELFQRAIMHSGSVLSASSLNDVDRTAPLKLAERLGLETKNMDEALTFLATQDTDSVIKAASEIDSAFWLCLESDHSGVEKLIADFPINQVVPKIQGKSVLLGFTEDELIVAFANMPPEAFAWMTMIHDYFRDNFTFEEDRLHNIVNIVKSFYLGGRDFSQELLHEIANFQSDNTFVYPTYNCIKSFLSNGAEKVFLFKFSYIGERNFVRRLANLTIGGAAHNDELGYLFDMQFIPEVPNAEDQIMIDRMTLMWTNFAKYGDPTPTTSDLVPVKWKPITLEDTVNHYLNIDLELTTSANPFHERMSLWNLIYEAFPEYQRGYKRNHSGSFHMIRNVYLFLMPYFLWIFIQYMF